MSETALTNLLEVIVFLSQHNCKVALARELGNKTGVQLKGKNGGSVNIYNTGKILFQGLGSERVKMVWMKWCKERGLNA